MKHLKLFEHMKYYHHIESDDYHDNLDERIEMSPKTIRTISELFTDWDISIDDNNDRISVDNENIYKELNTREYSINLYEVEDEYFYVEINRYYPNGGRFTYYRKCDQLDGFKKCIEDFI